MRPRRYADFCIGILHALVTPVYRRPRPAVASLFAAPNFRDPSLVVAVQVLAIFS
jgi:hypothetical protein